MHPHNPEEFHFAQFLAIKFIKRFYVSVLRVYEKMVLIQPTVFKHTIAYQLFSIGLTDLYVLFYFVTSCS